MPVRHTVICANGHEDELSTGYGDTISDHTCRECGAPIEILWKAKKDEYQVRFGLVDRL